jgi:hypothetical protein
MDAASAAAMSDPDNNRWFRRRWHDETTSQCSKMTWGAERAEAVEVTDRELLSQWRRELESRSSISPRSQTQPDAGENTSLGASA